ncbi:MAG: hypothetical protein RR444_12470 [Oscillospiraceae bacterium]
MFVKISNIIQGGGTVDYKGIDTKLFIPGTQVYDFDNNFCIVETKSADILDNTDLKEITEEEYNSTKDKINTNNLIVSPENRIKMLEQSQLEQDDLFMSILLGGN